MIKTYPVLLCGLALLAGRDCLIADAPTLNSEQIKSSVLYAPKPYYPSRARREYKTGAGIFLLNVDRETGAVTSIRSRRQPVVGVLMPRVLKH